MAENPDLLGILRALAAAERGREKLVVEFQEAMLADSAESLGSYGREVLETLANDLGYYEPSSRIRSQSSVYFGDDVLDDMLERALGQLNLSAK